MNMSPKTLVFALVCSVFDAKPHLHAWRRETQLGPRAGATPGKGIDRHKTVVHMLMSRLKTVLKHAVMGSADC